MSLEKPAKAARSGSSRSSTRAQSSSSVVTSTGIASSVKLIATATSRARTRKMGSVMAPSRPGGDPGSQLSWRSGSEIRWRTSGLAGPACEQAPLHGAVAQADAAHVAHGEGELRELLRAHLVLDGDQHRPAVGLEVVGDDRRRHLAGGCQVEALAGAQAQVAGGEQADHLAGCREVERRRDAEALADGPPEGAAAGQATEEDQHVDRDGPRAHPSRHRGLHRDVEARQQRQPGAARQQHHRQQRQEAVQQTEREGRRREHQGRRGHHEIGRVVAFQPRQHDGAGHRAGAQGGEQQAVAGGAVVQAARHHRQQRPERAGADHEGAAAGDRGQHLGRVTDVAHAGAHGAQHALSGQHRLLGRAAPAIEHRHHPEERDGVEEEGPARPRRRDDQAAQRGPGGARDVEPDAAEGDGGRQLAARHQLRDDGLPRRAVGGGAEAEQEGEAEQRPGRDPAGESQHAERGGGDGHPALRRQQQAAAVDDVGERAGRERQQEGRQAGRRLDQRHQHRGGGQRGHHPGGADVLQPGADVGRHGGDPQPAEERVAQRGPGAGRGRGGGGGG